MIFVDTSVWVEYFRGRHKGVIEALELLLDEDQVALAVPVRIELLTGASRKDLGPLRRVLSALPLFTPSEQVWPTIEKWVEASAARGDRFGLGDLLIASIAAENEGEIWSLDDNFARMARLGLVRTHSF